jgi:hypothetical protein
LASVRLVASVEVFDIIDPMTTEHRWLGIANCVLLVIAITLFGHLAYRQWQFRPQYWVGHRHNCDEKWTGWTAGYLAQHCRDLIKTEASSADRRNLLRRASLAILEEESWKDSPDLHLNSAQEPCDCRGQPYEMSFSSDRVTVTSRSSYSFYFSRFIRPKGE